MEECLFCQIISGKIAANKVYEDDQVMVFHDIKPKALIHVLIVPKKHFVTLNDLKEEDINLIGHIFLTAKKISQLLKVDKKGYRLIVNNGAAAGQEIAHLHVHLLSA